ncbi:tyrosine-type recombinase/integrase [Variovorax sp. RT4R15]|uniref:tyrosine-type recombinase/integrase n=1 Tax=Variovorax sp. RT4R15 TaxID=3443737 RepID=UPI003F477A5B
MAYIRKFRNGWRAEVQKHGARTSKVFETKREAQKWARDAELDLDAAKGSGGMTFGRAITKYLSTAAKEKAPGAAEWEERRLDEMALYFGEHTPLVAFTSVKLGEWRDARLKEVSGSTVIRQFSVLRCLFRVAVEEWKVVAVNPCKGVRMPAHNAARHQVWTWQLIKRVLRAENRNEREVETIRAFHIALHTSMRLNEILRARLVGKVAVLDRDKGSGKASAPVKVPLPRKGAALLAKYPAFTIQPDIASATFSDLTDELLIDGLTFHDARASALTWLSRRMDVMTLARISRHKNMKTLMESYYRETAEQIAARI